MSAQLTEEARFYWLLTAVLASRRPPNELVEDELFLKRGQRICYYIARGTDYDPEDMFQEASIKVWMFLSKLMQDDEPEVQLSFADVNAFFNWYTKIADRLRIDYFRKHGKRQEREVSLSENIAAALTVAAGGASPYADYVISEFEASLKNLPWGHQEAFRLKREGFSYEDIMVKLNTAGIKCTNKVTVRNWVMQALEFFDDDHSPEVKKVHSPRVKKAAGR